MTEHGSNVPPQLLEQVKQIEHERRALDQTLRQRIQDMVENARREGFELGYKTGKQYERTRWAPIARSLGYKEPTL